MRTKIKGYVLMVVLVLSTVRFGEYAIIADLPSIIHREDCKIESKRRENIVKVLMKVESGNNNTAKNGSSKGILQIRPIMIREVNNIVGYNMFSLNDRFDEKKSEEIFRIFTDYHTPDWDLELVARRWNGGHDGENKIETLPYYHRVKRMMDTIH